MNNNQLFYNGQTYKRHLKLETDKQNINLKFLTCQDETFIFDYGNQFQQIQLKSGYHTIVDHDILKQFQIRYNNYCIIAFCCSNNEIYQIQLGQMRHLISLNANKNRLKYIYLQKLDKLIQLNLHKNNLIQIDLSNNTKIKYLDLSDNLIKNINLKNNNKLINVDLQNNNIQSVILNDNIKRLNLRQNKIENLIIESSSKVEYLNISNNPNLKNVDIRCCSLKTLICENNNLTNFYVYNYDNIDNKSIKNTIINSI